MNIRREEDLAFASPIRASASDGNGGTATINQGTMLNVRDPNTNGLLDGFKNAGELANGPVTISFTNDGAGTIGFEVRGRDSDGDGTPDLLFDQDDVSWSYDPQKINTFFSNDPQAGNQYQGYQFELTGEPAQGDTFTIDFNKNGISDNRNAELLAGLGTQNTMNGRTQNFTEGYAGLVEDIGVKTRQSQLDKEASSTLLEQSNSQRESVSGVNLDEEAGKLIQYQAAYNASSKVMSVAQDLFTTLLQSFR